MIKRSLSKNIRLDWSAANVTVQVQGVVILDEDDADHPLPVPENPEPVFKNDLENSRPRHFSSNFSETFFYVVLEVKSQKPF